MFTFIKPIFAVTILSSTLIAPSLANENAKLFGKRADIEDVSISPDGSKISFVAPGPNRSNVLYVASTAGGTPTQVAIMDGEPETFSWCDFVSNERVACQIFAMVNFESTLIPTTRMVSFDIDGSDAKIVGLRDSDYAKYQRTGGGEILDWLDGSNEDVLLSWYVFPEAYRAGTRFAKKEEGLAVYRFNTRTGKMSTIEKPNKQADAYIADGQGNVRIMGIVATRGATGYAGRTIDWKYRKLGDDDWITLGSYNFLTRQGFYPQKIDVDNNRVFGLENLGDRDKLVSYSLDGKLSKQLVYEHPRYDARGLKTLGYGGRPIGIAYADDRSRIKYTDKKLEKLASALEKALPNLPSIGFTDASYDETKLLLRASSDTDAGRYYIFDTATNQLNELMLVRPDLENKKLAKVKSVSFPSRDGTPIPAYLTVPASSTGKNLPAIVMPHGGPEARDVWGFDWWAQFFAAEGYAVIQPNFRGSAGYGQDWFKDNGFKSWKIAIGDVNDAGKWLVSEGIANPSKLAIVGWSYGGYAALQSSVYEPDLFKAVIAVAPVTDLAQLKNEAKLYYNYTNTKEFIGSGPHIAAGSPARNAEKIKAPVLMFHGDRDLNVNIAQAKKMESALSAAGKSVELVEYENLEHGLRQTEARTDMLAKSSAFLTKHLGK